MFGKTTINRASVEHGDGFRQVVVDCVELGNLQLQLLSVDGKEAGQRLAKALVLGIVAVVGGLTTLLLAAMGAGWILHEQTELTVGVSFLIVAAVALVVSLLVAFLSGLLLRRATGSLQESVSELQANVKWIKEVLLDPDSARNRMRAPSFGEQRGSAQPDPIG